MTTDQIDRLYPAAPPVAGAPCPEAGLSLCLKGRLRGIDAQLTIRGKDRAEFFANVLGVLDLGTCAEGLAALFDGASTPSVAAPPAANGTARPGPDPGAEARPEGWCAIHGVQMLQQSNERGSWFSHYLGNHEFCRGKAKKGQ